MEDKKLYLIRHGKSSWGYENVSDIDRPLKNRGIRNAYEMSAHLKNSGIKPDLIVSSPANRALHTALIFAAELGYSYQDVRINELLYFSDETSILNFIKNTSDAVSTLLIFGHNPVTSNLANMFLKKSVDYIPTTGIAGFTFEANSWSAVSKVNLKSEFLEFPKKS